MLGGATPTNFSAMKVAIIFLALFGFGIAKFSPEGQDAIVKAHNDLRSAIATGDYMAKGTQQPEASNMMEMSWDKKIAQSAQRFAEGCPNTHPEKRIYGENIYKAWSSEEIEDLDPYGVKAAKKWEKEFQDYGWFSRTFTESMKPIGHATQMAWAETYKIGCGVKSCGWDPKKDMNKVVVVCRYKEAGNVEYEPIYRKGPTCSSCPSDTSCDTDSGLCA